MLSVGLIDHDPSFWQALWPNLVASVAGGLVVAAAAYVGIERWFAKSDRAKRQRAVIRIVLLEVHRELTNNREQAATLLKHASDAAIPYPLFDVNGWALLNDTGALLEFPDLEIELLVKLYNRLRTSNEQHAVVIDLLAGSTAAIVYAVAPTPARIEVFKRHKETAISGLVDRVTELLPLLDGAISGLDLFFAGAE